MLKNKSELVKTNWNSLAVFHRHEKEIIDIGVVHDTPVFLLDISDSHISNKTYDVVDLKSLLSAISRDFFQVISKAWHLILFIRTHRYCGRCGDKMNLFIRKQFVKCPSCDHICFPRISPCIIVAIKNENKILLANGRKHKPGVYSVLAGFVESGETLEQAIHREVYEEVGIRVTNLSYIASQSWPFPHSLMCGFIADFDSGEINVDGEEILEAKWFDVDHLPQTPPPLSITSLLINETVKIIKSDNE